MGYWTVRHMLGYWTVTGLSSRKGRGGVCNGFRSGMGFISIKSEFALSPLYDHLL